MVEETIELHKVVVVRYTENVAGLEGVTITNLKPRARVHTAHLIEFPSNTEHRYIPSERVGHYGHDEYLIPGGLRVLIYTSFQERVASCPDAYRVQKEAV